MTRMRRHARIVLAGAGIAVTVLLGTADVAHASTGVVVKTEGGPLKIRSAPAQTGTILGYLPNGGSTTVVCQQPGQNIVGVVRTTKAWDRLADGRFISDAYVWWAGARPPACAVSVPVSGAWVRPVVAPIWGGFRTRQNPNHDGVDLGALRNQPVVAAAAGTVVTAECNASTNNCDVDGSPTVAGCGWYVEVRHADNTVTRYCHLIRRPLVAIGQHIAAGQLIGNVGMSGNASAPHLHFEVHNGYPAVRANAIDPVPFMTSHAAPLGQTR